MRECYSRIRFCGPCKALIFAAEALQVECQRLHGLVCTVVYAPDDRVTAISIFNDYAFKQARACVDRADSDALLTEPATAMAARDRAHLGVADEK
jgi:hypothetical protein